MVIGAIVLPALLETGGGTKDVGLAGAIPAGLPASMRDAGRRRGRDSAVIHHYDTLAEGEQAVRDGEIDVLVVDASRLEWRRHADEQLRAVVTGCHPARRRAGACRLRPGSPQTISLSLMAPGFRSKRRARRKSTGRSPDDETAAFIMTVLLFMSIATYGQRWCSAVWSKRSRVRVVEVLLARIPPRTLLAGKIAGIGLLGLAQIAVTALAALVAVSVVDTADLPSVRAGALVWAVVWFVLGYALYATLFGALGSLASAAGGRCKVRPGPVSVVLVLVYFVSFAAIGSPDTSWARVVSWIPATAPIAMPTRIAMGAATWWEPLLAAVLTSAAPSLGLSCSADVSTPTRSCTTGRH